MVEAGVLLEPLRWLAPVRWYVLIPGLVLAVPAMMRMKFAADRDRFFAERPWALRCLLLGPACMLVFLGLDGAVGVCPYTGKGASVPNLLFCMNDAVKVVVAYVSAAGGLGILRVVCWSDARLTRVYRERVRQRDGTGGKK